MLAIFAIFGAGELLILSGKLLLGIAAIIFSIGRYLKLLAES